MEELELYIPKLEDLWFYQKMMSDPETMSYNAGWGVEYDGYGNVTALEPVLTEKRAALDTAQTSLVQAETDLKTVQGYLQQARAVYDADPTNENATSYNQIVGAYNLAYDAYASAFKTYSTAYDAYKPYEDQLIDALAIYQLYSNQQQAAFDD